MSLTSWIPPRAKHVIRDACATALYWANLTEPSSTARDRLSIVTFHRVLPETEQRVYPFPGLAVTPEELGALLRLFLTNFDCGTLARQHERYMRRERTDRPLLAITFDDGQYDNYKYALPVLARHGVKASFFIPVEALSKNELLWHDRLGFAVVALSAHGEQGRQRLRQATAAAGFGAQPLVPEVLVDQAKRLPPKHRTDLVSRLEGEAAPISVPDFARLMTIAELMDMARDGHEIGSHSMGHTLMPECSDDALKYETVESRRFLEHQLGRRVESFCYPNGDFDGRCIRAVAEAGFVRAVSTEWGSNGRDSNVFTLRRYDMDARRMRARSGELSAALVALRMSRFTRVKSGGTCQSI